MRTFIKPAECSANCDDPQCPYTHMPEEICRECGRDIDAQGRCGQCERDNEADRKRKDD